MSKTLNIIQTLFKIGKILSKILFVFCIVGFCICIVGIIGLAAGAPILKLGGVTLESFVQNTADMTEGALFAAMATAAIFCAGEGVLARFSVRYCERELTDGTPFTADGAQELLRLGVLSIAIPIAAQIVAQIVHVILEKTMTGVDAFEAEPIGSAAVGVTLIVMALLCRYGAELTEKKENPEIQE